MIPIRGNIYRVRNNLTNAPKVTSSIATNEDDAVTLYSIKQYDKILRRPDDHPISQEQRNGMSAVIVVATLEMKNKSTTSKEIIASKCLKDLHEMGDEISKFLQSKGIKKPTAWDHNSFTKFMQLSQLWVRDMAKP